MATLRKWLTEREWTDESVAEWQTFYNDASRLIEYGQAGNLSHGYMPHLPVYDDLKAAECKRGIQSSAVHQTSLFFLLILTSLCMIF